MGEQADLIRLAVAAVDTEGIRAGLEIAYAPDAVFVDLPEFPDGGEHHGRDAAIDHIEQFFAAWDDAKLELIEVLEEGDRAAAHFNLTGTGRSSGADTALDLWHVCAFRDGLVVRVEAFSKPEQALAALNAV